MDFDTLSKEDEHFWKKYFQSELFPILSPQIVDNRHPFPFLRNKEIYLGVLLKEKHSEEQSLGIDAHLQPDGADASSSGRRARLCLL